jgi:hypothetical protein
MPFLILFFLLTAIIGYVATLYVGWFGTVIGLFTSFVIITIVGKN